MSLEDEAKEAGPTGRARENCCDDCGVSGEESDLTDYRCEGFPVRLCEQCRCPECVPEAEIEEP